MFSLYENINKKLRPRGKRSTKVRITQKQKKKEKTLTKKMKRSPNERHT